MGSKTKTTQTNTHAFISHPGSADINALRGMKAEVDPTIPYHYAAAKENLANSFHNPLGAATSSATRDAASRVSSQRLGMDEANAVAGSYADAQNANMAHQTNVAQLTNPQMVQTGGTQVQSTPFNWGNLLMSGISGGAQLGGAAMM